MHRLRSALLAVAFFFTLDAFSIAQSFDLIVRNGRIVDGCGGPRERKKALRQVRKPTKNGIMGQDIKHAYPVASQIGAATEPTTYAALYNAGRRPKPLRRKTPVGN